MLVKKQKTHSQKLTVAYYRGVDTSTTSPTPGVSLSLSRPPSPVMQTFTTLRASKPLTYDVFISCGDDTRFSFTGFLANSLNDRGFYTCINHPQSIYHCTIFIFILSYDYASRSRLDELVKIMDVFAKGNGRRRRILPVYYHVSPSDVRHQTGRFGEGFVSVCKSFLIPDCETFEKWINVLRQVADFSGWHLDRCVPTLS